MSYFLYHYIRILDHIITNYVHVRAVLYCVLYRVLALHWSCSLCFAKRYQPYRFQFCWDFSFIWAHAS
jgi:hypothetical protein